MRPFATSFSRYSKAHQNLKVVRFEKNAGKRYAQAYAFLEAKGEILEVYLVKSCALEELVRGIRAVAAGKTYLSPDIAGSMVEAYVSRASGNAAPVRVTLSLRQREVLQLVAEGKSTKDIASILHVTAKTAEGHRHRLMKKLGLRSVAELTKYAIREGLTAVEG